MKVVLCTIIVVITSNLIRKITLNILCSVPCCEVQQIFFWLSKGRRWVIRTLNFKQVSYESGTLHNHCSDNLEPNSKEHSEYAVLCSLLRGSTDFSFFWLSMGRRWAIRTLNFKQVSNESGTLHNLCSYNFEPYSKDNCEYAVLCSLVNVQQGFFFSGSPWEDVGL